MMMMLNRFSNTIHVKVTTMIPTMGHKLTCHNTMKIARINHLMIKAKQRMIMTIQISF